MFRQLGMMQSFAARRAKELVLDFQKKTALFAVKNLNQLWVVAINPVALLPAGISTERREKTPAASNVVRFFMYLPEGKMLLDFAAKSVQIFGKVEIKFCTHARLAVSNLKSPHLTKIME